MAQPLRSPDQVRDGSLLGFLGQAQPVSNQLDEEARKYAGLARQAAEEQPTHPEISDRLNAAARIYASAAAMVGELVAVGRRNHDTDYTRVEQPRQGHQVEERADVEAAQNDGMV